MKGFVISLVILFVLTGAVIGNGIFVHEKTGELISMIDGMPTDAADAKTACTALKQTWDSYEAVFGLTVNHAEIEAIGAQITALAVWAAAERDAEYTATLAALREELDYLRRSESLCFESIM